MSSITRREWLQLMAASGITLAAGKAFGQRGPAPFTLEAKWITRTLNGNRAMLRSYNGQVPGPLLKVRPGETLRIRLKNSLFAPPNTPARGAVPPGVSTKWNHDHNVPHEFEVTNLHTHGFDTIPHLFAPLGTSDPASKMIAVRPGESFDYAFPLPEDHPPGLYWYHPHHHGSTAVQAVTGMAGGIIIYGDVDEVPEIKAARDIPLVVNDIGLFPHETTPNLWLYNPTQNAIWQTFGGNVTIYDPATKQNVATKLKGGFTTGDYPLRYYLLNGQPFYEETHNPNIPTEPLGAQLPYQKFTVAPGEVVRFRMLNACSDNFMPILIEGHDVHMIALDGVNFPAPRTVPALSGTCPAPQFSLAPSNRAEFLIKGSGTPGTYRILELEQDEQFLFSDSKVIAVIEVTGTAKNMNLPATLPTPGRYYPLIKPDEIARKRTLTFAANFPAQKNLFVGLDFMINDRLYDEQVVPADDRVKLNTAEEWTITVPDHDHGGTEGHPFHIHVDHFEVISVGGAQLPPGTIQDTLWVPKNTSAVIRLRFLGFKGKAVYHCHILPHEDTGMMQNFLIE
jgi:FtsP/CotA-like multicopper oxidase with cupredoxin domain